MKIPKDNLSYNLFKKFKFLKNKTIQPKRYLNIFWNQHQPYYKDEAGDYFAQPWVRLHACKDYYDMAEILENYPNVHVSINLSASLLRQLDEYLEKLYDFADISSSKYRDLKYYPYGKVDPYLDLTLKPVEEWTKEDKEFALKNFFNADYKAQIQIFPGYKYLYDKKNKGSSFTLEDFCDLKVWFNLSWMDYSFQSGDVLLKGIDVNGNPLKPQEWVKDADDLVKKGIQAGYKNARFTEIDAKNLILDQYKIMKYVVPIHRYLMRRKSPDGYPQIEVVTTPFYHPILPLINDINTAKEADPDISLPREKFSAPEDTFAQVIKGEEYYKQKFGSFPQGMWPGEGAVAESIIPAFQKNQIRWIASGDEVAFHSGHAGDNGLIYRIDNDHEYIDHDGPSGQTNNSDAMSIVFRSIHDKIGFDYGVYQGKIDGKVAAEDFLNDVKNWKHSNNVPQDEDILITNLADGENTWINYLHDGKEFLEALYGKLNENKEIITTTPSIFIDNHPIDKQWELEPLAAGTWVNGSFKKWLGKESKNEAWRRLKIARDALINAQVPQSDPHLSCPDPSLDRKGYFIWKAWESLYAAEGSDWFWWYENNQGNQKEQDAKFSENQREHLVNTYVFTQKAGFDTDYPAELKKPLDVSLKEIPIPPITRNPKVLKINNQFQISLEVFSPKEEKESYISKVWIDISPLGGEKEFPLKLKEGNIYSTLISLEITKKSLLKVYAQSNTGAVSYDYIILNNAVPF